MTIQKANSILKKLDLPQIRQANHFEKTIDEYGQKAIWVLDQGERQAQKTFPTIDTAIAYAYKYLMPENGPVLDWGQLTPSEYQDLETILQGR